VNSGTPVHTVQLVSLPDKSNLSAAEKDMTFEQRAELAQLAKTIREEERKVMQYEDERRRMVLQAYPPEETHGQSKGHTSQYAYGGGGAGAAGSAAGTSSRANNNKPFANGGAAGSNASVGTAHSGGSGSVIGKGGFAGAGRVNANIVGAASAGAGHYSTDYFFDTPIAAVASATRTTYSSASASAGAAPKSPGGPSGAGAVMHIPGRKPSQQEVDAAFKWLSVPRVLVIAERTPKEYVFMVTATGNDANYGDTPGAESKGAAASVGKSYSLEWREGTARAGSLPEFIAGHVVLSDFKELVGPSGENDTFTLVLGSSAKALKNSKGRTTVVIKCSSPGECAKYMASLRCIRRSFDD
jgi:hypothetical protein